MVMKLEVGRTYVDKYNNKVRCIGLIPENVNWPYVCTIVDRDKLMRPFLIDINGDHDSDTATLNNRMSRLIKEYREPIIHKKDVVWFKLNHDGHVQCEITEVGHKLYSELEMGRRIIELKRETVTYTEEGCH